MKAKCLTCGVVVRVVIPPGGDASTLVYTRHDHGAERCAGSRRLLTAALSREIHAAHVNAAGDAKDPTP